MTASYVDTLRTTWVTSLGTAAGNAAQLLICSGTRPAKGTTTPTPLVTFTCGSPFFNNGGAAVNGVGTANAIGSQPATAGGAGTIATWARLRTSGGTFVADLDVTITNGGGDVTLDNTTIVGPSPGPASTVAITSLTITAPGAV